LRLAKFTKIMWWKPSW